MASKYDGLAAHLRQQQGGTHTMTFSDVASAIGQDSLPNSAYYAHRLWWKNVPHQTQAGNGWLAAGWKVGTVDVIAQTVTFRKERPRP